MANEENKLLIMKDITKSYSGIKVLKHVQFDLRPGEVHALVGENGAGKSTLVKILMGIVEKDGGDIYINAKKVDIKNPFYAGHLGIAAVFQELSQIPTLTVAENVFLGREHKRTRFLIDRQIMIKETRKILNRYNIELDPKLKLSQLSIAKRQLAEIVKAISVNPKILILDEPTSSLTERETNILFTIIEEFKKKGVGIIYISHRMNEIFSISDRVTVLRDGDFIGSYNTNELDIGKIVKLIVGREVDLYSSTSKKISRYNKKPLLEFRNVSKSGRFKDISFELYEGEILGVAGLVGSGRTELMNLLFGIDRADSGEILLNEKPIAISSVKDALKHGIAMIPENRHQQGLVLMHSIEQNIILPNLKEFTKWGIFLNLSKIEKFIAEQMRLLNIKAENGKKIVNYLSGGNQQKVVIAKWLSLKPKILIVDELTSGIDVHSKAEIHKLMRSLADSGVGIIMISSEMPELLAHSDRIMVVNNNRIIGVYDKTTQEEIMSTILYDNVQNKSKKRSEVN